MRQRWSRFSGREANIRKWRMYVYSCIVVVSWPGCSDTLDHNRRFERRRRPPQTSHPTAAATKYNQKIANPLISVPLIFRIFRKNQLLRVIDDTISLFLLIASHQYLNNNLCLLLLYQVSTLVAMPLVLFFCSCGSISWLTCVFVAIVVDFF